MRLVIYLNVESPAEAAAVANALKPWMEKIVNTNTNFMQVQRVREHMEERQDLILRHPLTAPLPMSRFFRSTCCRQLYGASYKKFQRDVYDLIAHGKLTITEADGTVLIRRPEASS